MSRTARTARAALLAALLLGAWTEPVFAFGGRWLWSASFRSYSYPVYPGSAASFSLPTYYSPSPVVCIPAAPAVTPVPVVRVPPGGGYYAQPVPAPPSSPPKQTVEPPIPKAPVPAPKVVESRFSTDAMKIATGATERCQVGFWNVTGRDVTLIVNGQKRQLPRDRNLTLIVGRQFDWQMDQQPARQARVPAGSSSVEIVLR